MCPSPSLKQEVMKTVIKQLFLSLSERGFYAYQSLEHLSKEVSS